jgi:hypothetical protein
MRHLKNKKQSSQSFRIAARRKFLVFQMLNLALSLGGLAATTKDPKAFERYVSSARKAYDRAFRSREGLGFTPGDCRTFDSMSTRADVLIGELERRIQRITIHLLLGETQRAKTTARLHLPRQSEERQSSSRR